MKFRSAFAVLSMTVALTACGKLPFQQTAAVPEAPAHSGPPAVSPLEQPIETGAGAVPVAMAEASTLGTAMFRAVGTGWTVTAADKTAVYERSGQKSVGVTVRRMTYGKGVEFVGNMNGSVFSLNVRAQSCDAGGTTTPFTARLKVGSQSMTGCAAPTDTMPKAQVKASSAAPKPKTVAKPAAPAAKPTAPTPAATSPAATPAPATGATSSTAPSTAPATTPTVTPAPTTAPASSTVTTPATTAPAATPATPAPATPAPAATTPAPAATTAPLNEPAAPAAVLPPATTTPSQ